jgi:anti-anti-sigma regulatory factor
MLRITPVDRKGVKMLHLEGKLVGPWVNEMKAACEQVAGLPSPVALDLSAVTYVDEAGMALLRQLVQQGVGFAGVSRFVAELLRWEKP